jgi:2-aminoadipate transaminase
VTRDPFLHLYSPQACTQQASSIREICKLATRPEVRSLAGGWPGRETFPAEIVARIAADVLREKGPDALQYGTTEGLAELRQAIVTWARDRERMDLGLDQVIVVHGSQQGMDLAFRVFVEPGDVALVGLPTYFGGTGALQALGARLVGVPVDADGMDVAHAERELARLAAEGARVKLAYVIPNFQNPTGECLSLPRRRRWLELAAQYDFVIVEDDPYGDLRFEGEWIPSLFALAAEVGAVGRVVHVHSFSKTFAPGLRLAWVAAEPGVARKMVIAKQYVDCCTNTLGQHLLDGFIRGGHLETQIRANIAHYRRQRDHMLAALAEHFPAAARYERPQGGLFVFVRLPEGLDGDALMAEAIAENVAFVSGSQFFVDGSGRNTLRLSYSQSNPETIDLAVAGIGKLLRRHLDTP